MRAAPPVQVPSRGAGLWHGVQSALQTVAAAVALYWVAAHVVGPDARLAAASLLAGALLALLARRQPGEADCHLAWDGQTWLLGVGAAEPVAGRVAVMLDLGGWMLLRFDALAPGRRAWRRRRWLPLARRDAGAAWSAVRAALYALPSATAATAPNLPALPAA